MAGLRISAISFLNTAPLMWDFEHGDAAKEFEIAYTTPAECAEALQAGTADIGIVPAIACQTIPELAVIPGIAIASHGAVRSILLVSKVATEAIRSVAVDSSSRTSVAMLEIMFHHGWLTAHPAPDGKILPAPKFAPVEPALDKMLAAHDAALIIGDPALSVDRSGYHIMDLGEVWSRVTGLPFVYALWAVRKAAVKGMDTAKLVTTFQQSRDHGLANAEEIAKEWSPKAKISPPDVKRYLTHTIDYQLGPEQMKGLDRFYTEAKTCGILKTIGALNFLK